MAHCRPPKKATARKKAPSTSTPTRRSARIAASSLHKATPGTSQDSPLLNLAPELRNRIYEFALVDEDDIPVKKNSDHLLPKYGPTEPGLLRACQQLRHEGTPIYYGGNHFSSHHGAWPLLWWMKQIGGDKTDMLRWVDVHNGQDVDERDTPARVLSGMWMFAVVLFVEGVLLRDDVWRRACYVDGDVVYLNESELRARLSTEELDEVKAATNTTWGRLRGRP